MAMVASLNLLGGAKLKYRQAFGVTCYSLLPTGVEAMNVPEPAKFDPERALLLRSPVMAMVKY
jgi:hypothetical protein